MTGMKVTKHESRATAMMSTIVTFGFSSRPSFLTLKSYLHHLGPWAWGRGGGDGLEEHGYNPGLKQGGETTDIRECGSGWP